MTPTNLQVFEYLRTFCDMPVPPEYAVLIKGKWGSGKTWFIEQLTKKLTDDNVNVLRISLYGLSSISEIDSQFFRLLHPILGSKSMVLTGKVLKSALEASLKIENEGTEFSIKSIIPGLDVSKSLTNLEKSVLIFDDVERNNIEISKLLGYFNHLVEFAGSKVILVANEDEIFSGENGELYRKTKEKLIGKTFEIEPEVNQAIVSFIDENHSPFATYFTSHQSTIEQVFYESGYKNLRHIRQSLQDIEWILDAVPQSGFEKSDLIRYLIANYLIFSIEIKSGNLKPEEIKNSLTKWAELTTNPDDEDNFIAKLSDKYSVFDYRNLVLSPDLWSVIFAKGVFDKDKVQKEVTDSAYFVDENTETWQRLWYTKDLEDSKINELLSDVETKFKNHQYQDLYVVLHVFGILLTLLEIGIYKKSLKTHIKETKKHIDCLKSNGVLLNYKNILHDRYRYDDSFNLGYHKSKHPAFIAITNYVDKKIQEAVSSNYPNDAQRLLVLMQSNTREFVYELKSNDYREVSILSKFKVNSTATSFLALKRSDKIRFLDCIKERITTPELVDERTFYNKLGKRLEIIGRKNKNTMLGYWANDASKQILNSLPPTSPTNPPDAQSLAR